MIDLHDKLLLAPLAGYSDLIFRSLARRYGADATVTEMVSIKGILYGQEKTFELMESDGTDRPFGVQLFGSDPGQFGEAAAIVEERVRPDFIDVNCGCPVKKVLKQDAGAELLRDPARIAAIVARLKASVSLPVSIKIRLGYSAAEKNHLEVCRMAEEAGVDFIAVHTRTRPEFYSGPPDLEALASLRKSVSVPLVGNGGVCDTETWRRMRETGCDSVMIGQAAMASPWIFRDLRQERSGGAIETGLAEKIGVFREHILLLTQKMGDDAGLRTGRALAMQYIKKIFRGVKGKQELMKKFFDLKTTVDAVRFFDILDRFTETG